MKAVYVRGLAIGEGRPKICIPICGKTKTEIIDEAKKILELPADIVEWRGDWYEDIFDESCLKEVLSGLRQVLGELPILFTFRSIQEGGERPITPEEYLKLANDVCESECVDAFDVELFMDERVNAFIVEKVHACGMTVIASNHDFQKTPAKDELTRRMMFMDEMGADILKIAVMPKTMSDVLELLTATEEMGRLYTDKPIITMSMGPMGVISRLAGESFGSALTFGAGEKASAPGQIPAKELKEVLDIIHKSVK